MTSFPMTAPRFTDEDERRELEGLSEAERAEIERDVKGDDASPEVADLDPILAKSLVAEAMEAIDSSERQAYDLAIRTNGQLVDSESNPVWYLRCCRHDPWMAANRLARYWEVRVKLFGDNAFLPLVTASEGALTKEATKILDLCVFTRLGDDPKNRAIFCVDRSRVPDDSRLRLAILQAMFYTLTAMLTESEYAQQNGVVILIVGTGSIARFDRKRSKECLALLKDDVFPFDVKAIHLFMVGILPPFDFVIPIIKHLMGKHLRRRLTVHAGAEGQILHEMEENYGLPRESLPSQLGGDVDVVDRHRQWLQRRRAKGK